MLTDTPPINRSKKDPSPDPPPPSNSFSTFIKSSPLLTYLSSPSLVSRFQCYIKIGHPLFHPLFKFGSQLGDEIFYAFWFCNWFWNIDGWTGRRVAVIWAICMYFGQALKDILCIPRPPSPPVTHLESKWIKEYGFPSTHAVVGAAVPFATIFFTSNRYAYPVEIGVVIATLWAILVSCSRIYLGMHSVLDILGGLSLVATLFLPLLPLVDYLDPIILTSPYGGLLVVMASIALALAFPGDKNRWTPARGDTMVILGSATGFMVGYWLNVQLSLMTAHPPPLLSPPYSIIWPSAAMALTGILRLIIGLPIVGVTRQVGKAAFRFFYSGMQKAFPSSISPHFPDLATKYSTYLVMAINVVMTAQIAFRIIGIQRNTFHTEF